MTHCYSCGAIVQNKQPKEIAYCEYCLDNEGNLKDRSSIKNGVAGWLKQWSPEELSHKVALERAELYLQSMPKWANKNLSNQI